MRAIRAAPAALAGRYRPKAFLKKAAIVIPAARRACLPASYRAVHGSLRQTWAQTYTRCRRLAPALRKKGIRKGDTVALMEPNIPAAYEVALRQVKRKIAVIDIVDPVRREQGGSEDELVGSMDYESFLATGEADDEWRMPGNEWDAIALSYTSGTTGNPRARSITSATPT